MPASDPGANLFGPPPPDPTAEARAEYLHLTRVALPAAARAAAAAGQPWPIHLDHCFMRVVLDHVVGRAWRDGLSRRGTPAYRQLTPPRLNRAIATARSMLAGGRTRVVELNDASLTARHLADIVRG